jgi:sugar phosphate isomerase/epimerase
LSGAIDRRVFIATAVGAIAGLKARTLFAQTKAKSKLDRIGLQLHTVRDMMKKSVSRTLTTVAKAGYKEVEFAGYFNKPVVEVKKMLDDNGLVSPSANVAMTDLGPMWEAFLEDANTLGQQYLTVTWIDAPERTLDGYKRVAARFNAAGARARREGVQLAYHNSSYEWMPVRGRIPYQILLDECDAQNLAMEADAYWMRQAKQDPLTWFAKYPGRFHMLHAKDMGPAPRRAMLDVGKGTLDWRALLSEGTRAGVKHVFVENDQARDPLASIRSSYKYLRGLRY